jgi:hypothetical protein
MEKQLRSFRKRNSALSLKWIIISSVALVLYSSLLFIGLVHQTGFSGFTGKEKSIAVLPFENISNDTLQQYFSDGINRMNIITQLSKIAGLERLSPVLQLCSTGGPKKI